MTDHADFAGVMVDEITKNADRLGLSWKLIPGTVQSDVDPAASTRVLVDGDSTALTFCMSLVGPVTKNLRVMVLFIPPHAAYIIGEYTVPPWTPFPFGSNWSNLGGLPCAYRRVGDVVELRGAAVKGVGSAITIGQLPAGFRPPALVIFASVDSNSFSRLDVLADGSVQAPLTGIPASAFFSLSPARFSVTP